MPFKDPHTKSLVVDALLSGKYRKITGRLRESDENTGEPVGFCALGVACHATNEPMNDIMTSPSNLTLEHWGLTRKEAGQIMYFNDDCRHTLKEIGCWIQKNL